MQPTSLTPALIVRAWKDPSFARTLPADLQRMLPPNPAGAGAASPAGLDVDPGVVGQLSASCLSSSCLSSKCLSTACLSTSCLSTQCLSYACLTGRKHCGPS
jgi:mersacidin/lichenicidin family type 2 lantibiotic